ncbi:MAG: DUF167 domain-containing protein [Alphaproteobacteria bacterium]|nr:DUF167 domain-containing protein [Alphaproteobacteria bacterium]
MQNSKQIFNVRVIPRAKQNSITLDNDGTVRVHTTTAPTDGRANDAVIRALAKYWDVPRSSLRIIRGETSHNKVVQIV